LFHAAERLRKTGTLEADAPYLDRDVANSAFVATGD
jgi:hypothetical protein